MTRKKPHVTIRYAPAVTAERITISFTVRKPMWLRILRGLWRDLIPLAFFVYAGCVAVGIVMGLFGWMIPMESPPLPGHWFARWWGLAAVFALTLQRAVKHAQEDD